MIEWVQKRDGRIVPFNAEKIADAIFAAAKAVGGEDRRQAEFLAGQVIHLLQQNSLTGHVPQVEEIQDLVERTLIEHGHARTAKAYILYRNQRTRIREAKSELMDVVSEIFQEHGQDFGASLTGLGKLQRVALAASERYTLNNMLPREFSLAHQRAAIHIDQLAHYANSPDSYALDASGPLQRGLRIGAVTLPPVRTLDELFAGLRLLTTALSTEVAGEVLIRDLDQSFEVLAPTLDWEPDEMQLQSALSGWLLELNALQGISGDLGPRLGVSFGAATGPLGRMFSRAMLQCYQQGIADARTVRTPQLVYHLRQGHNLRADDPGWELTRLARETARRRGNPSFVWADDQSVYFPGGTRLPQGGQGVVARAYLNIPRLVLEADSLFDLWSIVDAAVSLVARQLVHRYEVLQGLSAADLPFIYGELGGGEPLKGWLLLLVPVGISEAMQAAVSRFGQRPELREASFLRLLEEILEKWRSYYSLPLHPGLAPAASVARRFYRADQAAFPLAETIWPDLERYSFDLSDPDAQPASGGQLRIVTEVGQPAPNQVIALDYRQGASREGEGDPNGQLPFQPELVREDGYLVHRRA
ncbi:MAG: anaerobic ribonucleoside-triphosphate reductase [Bacillota bacterium]|jgi:hypothetical protein